MKLGMEVGLGPGHIDLDGDQTPHGKENSNPPTFRPTLLWHGHPSQQLLSPFYFRTFNYRLVSRYRVKCLDLIPRPYVIVDSMILKKCQFRK